MNLLVLSPWFPCPPDNGSRLRAFHLLREWANAGHCIRLVAGLQKDIADRADRETLERFCESVAVVPWHWHDGAARSELDDWLSPVPRSITGTDNPSIRDAMTREIARMPDACVAMELAAAPFIPKDTNGVPVLLEQVEVSGVGRAVSVAIGARAKLRTALTRAKHDRYWRRELRRFDAMTSVSEEEAASVRALIGSASPPVIVAPNGVDTAHYIPRTTETVAGRMIYSGSLTYGPNREAVSWFVDTILPRIAEKIPDAHLVVTGTLSPDAGARLAENSRVTLTGFVPDLRPILASAAICVVPLKTGGGTRLKVLEAWAAGVPVVSTGIGATGLAGSENGTHLLFADTADDFAEACVRLFDDPERGRRIAAAARHLVKERYDWHGIAGGIIDLLGRLRGT